MISRRNRRETGTSDADRAVSDMIAFVLVFAVIIGSVALLSTTGFQAMTDYQEGEQLRNAERAMVSLADNFNDVLRYDGIEQRYGELSLREGTITTGDSGTVVDITIENESDEVYNEPHDLGEFAYESGSDVIAYEGGGVVRSDGDGSVVLERPRLTCNSETAVISLIAVDSENRSIQSSGGLGLTMTETNSTRAVYDGIDNVSISTESTSYDGAWNDTLGGTTWSCDNKELDRAIVTIVTVELEY